MSETLWGVVIGGAIGIISSLIVLSANYYIWKKTKKIENLRLLRDRKASLCQKVIDELPKALTEQTWPVDFGTDVILFLSEKASECLKVARQSESEEEKRAAFWDIVILLKKDVARIDEKIETLIS